MKVMSGDKLQKKKLGLINEINILSKNSNPYLLKFYEVFLENNNFHIIMEYAARKDLKSFLSQRKSMGRKLSDKSINRFFYQICQGVKYLHDHNVIHRDLKPANIMVDSNLNLKIGDFGISKIFTDKNKFAVTQIGSPMYMSPEALGEGKYYHKTDIWALGCILYELITLDYAFNANSLPALYKVIKRAGYDSYKIRNDDYLYLINKMLCVDQYTRPDIDQLIELIPSIDDNIKLKKTSNKLLPAIIIPQDNRQWYQILPEPSYSPINRNLSLPDIKDTEQEKEKDNILRSKSQLENYHDKIESDHDRILKLNNYYYKNNKLPDMKSNVLKNQRYEYYRNNLPINNKVNPYSRYNQKNNYYDRNLPKNDNDNLSKVNPYSRNALKNDLTPFTKKDNSDQKSKLLFHNNLPKIVHHNQRYRINSNASNLRQYQKQIYQANYNRVLPSIDKNNLKAIYNPNHKYGKNYVSPYNQFVLRKNIDYAYKKGCGNHFVSEYRDKFKNLIYQKYNCSI